MAEVIAVTNQKGGVGKTTTVLNMGALLCKAGKKVLFIDLDPQCSLTYSLGGEMNVAGVFEILMQEATASSVVQRLEEGDLICANSNLSAMDMNLTQQGKEYLLRKGIEPLKNLYDYIIIDSPPTLGILTINILTASDKVVIPVLADILSIQGVGQLYATIDAVRTYCNSDLQIAGLLLTRHTERFLLNREMREMLVEVANQIGTKVFDCSIRESVAVREAQALQKSIFSHAPKSKQAMDYVAFVTELIN